MNNNIDSAFEQMVSHARETALLSSIEELLGWDERTIMPPHAGAYRAEQMTYLAGLSHKRKTDRQVGEWLNESEQAIDRDATDQAQIDRVATIRRIRREFDRATKIPQSLVEELTRQSVLGQQIWVEARRADDFEKFKPVLEKIVELKREEAAAIGYSDSPYDPLLDEFEPGETTANVTKVLGELRDELVPLVAAIMDSGKQLPIEITQRKFPIERQKTFSRKVIRKIGFDFDRGRIDETEHPFCATMGPSDCRITTRYNDNHFNGAFIGTLHEVCH